MTFIYFSLLHFYVTKKLLLPALSVVLAFASCQKNENPATDNSVEFKNVQAQADPASIDTSGFTSDSLTEAFILKSTEIKHSSINIATLNSAIADDTITEGEMSDVAGAFGFDSKEQFMDYLSDLQKLSDQLNDKYHLTELNQSEVKLLFKNALLSYLNKLANQLASEGSSNIQTTGDGNFTCAETFEMCTSTAYGIEAQELVICNGGDLFPPVAFLCFASVMVGTYVMLDNCANAYDACIDDRWQCPLSEAIYATLYNK